ncbi:84eb23df-4d1b-4345-a1a4-d3d898bca6b4-CDS [Sclerotinia trifoliorum]|uniref:84eb23df-4d1b-4345-a1a4-d3d898bca6b4-CDS n=1 Tax=Sclerotinia trifoliorum TaxID=28548 RepID=A0A8H2VY87_9HELO|nr:84eb23df-4d1b-4345-a1a4-d3d898bca6b4-CDS [Sclerotinia trifoliorum]
MACVTPHFTPHYYNLDLPINATQKHVKQAYRRLVKLIHPDKIRDPDQKENALEAIHLINEAYRVLTDNEKLLEYRYQCERFEWDCHGKHDLPLTWELNYWNEEWNSRCRNVTSTAPKPWFWHYDSGSTGTMCVYSDQPIGPLGLDYLTEPDQSFCTATWVNLVHLFVDNGLPNPIGDNIWRWAESWRDRRLNGTKPKYEYLHFQRGCDHYQVMVSRKEAYTPWSQIPANTDWPTIGYACELFCPDILILPFTLYIIVLYLLLSICLSILRKLSRQLSLAFWPPSAISSPTLDDSLVDDIMTRSQRESQSSAVGPQSSSDISERDYYADGEATSRYSSDKLSQTQFYDSVASQSRPTNPLGRALSTHNYSAEETQTPYTNLPDQSLPTRDYTASNSHTRSTNPTDISSPTQFFSAAAQPAGSPANPSQLLSLKSSEKHWYYSDKDGVHDLPLRERRNPLAPYEPLRPRFVHYEDEQYADDERTPRPCMALTATGKPCQRRVSMVTPLTGSTVSGLVSPLCFQHRHIRRWIRNISGQDPSTPGKSSLVGNLPGSERRPVVA